MCGKHSGIKVDPVVRAELMASARWYGDSLSDYLGMLNRRMASSVSATRRALNAHMRLMIQPGGEEFVSLYVDRWLWEFVSRNAGVLTGNPVGFRGTVYGLAVWRYLSQRFERSGVCAVFRATEYGLYHYTGEPSAVSKLIAGAKMFGVPDIVFERGDGEKGFIEIKSGKVGSGEASRLLAYSMCAKVCGIKRKILVAPEFSGGGTQRKGSVDWFTELGGGDYGYEVVRLQLFSDLDRILPTARA